MIMIRSILTITCVLILVAVGYPASNKLQDKPDTVFKGKFIQSYSKLPVFFEPSQNKMTGEANFISRGDGYLLSLSPGEARFLLIRHDVTVDKHSSSKATFLRMQFIDGNPSPEVKGYKLLPGKSNYLLGNDRKTWRTNIPHYAEVRYKGVYPGIDLVYHGSQYRLEYDFMVAPGTDPKVIQIAFQGVDELAIDRDGNLILRTAVGEILMRRPNAYQEVDGVSKQINASYTLKGKEQVAFAVGDYDAKRPLVIDPEVVYSTYLGGTGSDRALAVAAGRDGSVYVTGETNSGKYPGDTEEDLFPTTPGVFQDRLGGDVDAFVTKFNPNGTLSYSTYLGGGGRDKGSGIAVDDNGQVYVTGLTASGGDFGPIFPGAVNNLGSDSGDAFLAVISPDGSDIISRFIGGKRADEGNAAVITKRKYDVSVPCSTCVGDRICESLSGELVCLGDHVRWDRVCLDDGITKTSDKCMEAVPTEDLLCEETDTGDSLCLNKANGDLVCLGDATEWDRVCLDANGSLACVDDYYITDDMVCKEAPDDLDCSILTDPVPQDTACSEGLSFCWYQPVAEEPWSWDCVHSEEITSGMVCLDQPDQFCQDEATGDMACIAGMTFSKNFPITGLTAYQSESSSCGDAFVTCYQTPIYEQGEFKNTFVLRYSTFLAGSGVDEGSGISTDDHSHLYVAGDTVSNNFPVKDAYQGQDRDSMMVFVSKLDPNWQPPDTVQITSGGPPITPEYKSLIWSTMLGGESVDEGMGVAVDSKGTAWVTGDTISENFPITPDAAKLAKGDSYDVFLTGLGLIIDTNSLPNFVRLNPIYSTFWGGMDRDTGRAIAVDTEDNILMTGNTKSPNFPTASPLKLCGYDGEDALLTRFTKGLDALTGLETFVPDYSTCFGGSASEIGKGMVINNYGNAVIVGETVSDDLPATQDAYDGYYNYDPEKGYLPDAFLAEISGVRPQGTADIMATNADAPDPVEVDVSSKLTWTMKVINTGPEDAPAISVIDRLPLVDVDVDGFPETISVKLLGIWVDGVEVPKCDSCSEPCAICYSLTKDNSRIKNDYIVQFNIGPTNASTMRTIIIVAMPLASGELLNHIEVCAAESFVETCTCSTGNYQCGDEGCTEWEKTFTCDSELDTNPANNIATARTQSQGGNLLEVE